MPIPEKANSLILLRPMTTAPPARSRATASASSVAGDVEKILDRNRQSRERRRHGSAHSQVVGGIGGEQRALSVHFGENAPALAARVGDARERCLDELAACGLALGKL